MLAFPVRDAETLRSMPWPVILIDQERKIQLWNAVAQKLFGVGATSVVGVELARLPLEQSLRNELLPSWKPTNASVRPPESRDASPSNPSSLSISSARSCFYQYSISP